MKLVSPEYSLGTFCSHMHDKHPLVIMQAASAEIVYARSLHRKTTQDSDFRKGSRGRSREYCESLEKLVLLIGKGSVPTGCTPEFLATVKPLIQQFLQQWEIGNLRQAFLDFQALESIGMPETVDPLIIVISRAEVEAMDTSAALWYADEEAGRASTSN